MVAYPAATRAAVAFPLSMRASQDWYRSSLPPPVQLDDIRRSRTGVNDMRGPCVQSSGLFLGEFVPLINRSDASQLPRLVRQQLVNHDAIKAEARQRRDTRAPKIMQTPWRRSFQLGLGLDLASDPCHRRIERGFSLGETGNRRRAGRAENQVAPLDSRYGPQNGAGGLR